METLELRGIIINTADNVLEIKPYSTSGKTIKIPSKKQFKEGDEVKIEYIEDVSVYKITRVSSTRQKFQIEDIYEDENCFLVSFRNEKLTFQKEFSVCDIIFNKIKKDNFLKAIVFNDFRIMYDIDYYLA